jgi:hypothetical protein
MSTVSGVATSSLGLLKVVLTLAAVAFVVAGLVAFARDRLRRRRARRAGSPPPA